MQSAGLSTKCQSPLQHWNDAWRPGESLRRNRELQEGYRATALVLPKHEQLGECAETSRQFSRSRVLAPKGRRDKVCIIWLLSLTYDKHNILWRPLFFE